jgi:eukaryotic-like serine/threonine-protein kinase
VHEFTVADDPLIGTVVGGRYRIVRKLSEGGMGVLYVARHEVIEKLFALKVLSSDAARRPDLVERFLREARAVAAIVHAHVLNAADFGRTDDGAVYFATELLEGRDLLDEVRGGGVMAPRRAARVVIQILRGLEAAHDQGVIHRDLKPENIFLTTRDGDRDFVKVLDFGLAKIEGLHGLTAPGQVIGTPEYFSPEQGLGKNVDARSDLYSVGCILYAIVCGRPPFMSPDPYEVMKGHAGQLPMPPSLRLPDAKLPEVFDDFVGKALAKPLEERFQSASEMRGALEAILDQLPEQAVSPSGRQVMLRSPASMDGQTPLPPPAAPSAWTQKNKVEPTEPAAPLIPARMAAEALGKLPPRRDERSFGRAQAIALSAGAGAAVLLAFTIWLVLRLLR